MLDLVRANPSRPFQQLIEHLKEANWQVEQDAEVQRRIGGPVAGHLLDPENLTLRHHYESPQTPSFSN